MKKAIAILAVLLIGALVFADPLDTADLTLTTNVPGVQAIKLADEALTLTTFGAEDKDETLAFESLDPEVVPADKTAYINLKTNKAGSYTISLSGAALQSSTVTTTIGYEIAAVAGTGYSVGSALTVLKTDTSTPKTVASFVTFTTAQGMRVVPAQFTVALTDADWLAATAATDYTTTVTVDLVTP